MATDKGDQGAKKKVSRTAVKKVKDKWKAKVWYNIRAPPMYNGAIIAETLADDGAKLMGRIAEATLQDLTGDFSKMHIKMKFKVQAVRGNECATKFAGHELTSDYIRRLTRRKHSKIDSVIDVVTKDGFKLRIKPMAVTDRRAQSSQEGEIRKLAVSVIQGAAQESDHGTFIKAVVNGDLSQIIYNQARKIYPLKRVEIRKSEVTSEPEQYFSQVDLFAAPEPEPVAEAPAVEGEATDAPAADASEEEQL